MDGDVDNRDLKLFGDKIKLETRPLSKESTASSRCALIGRNIARPFSAIPSLNLYTKDDLDFEPNPRRPFSADCVQNNFRNKPDNNGTPKQLTDESKNLPSNHLLNELICQPINVLINADDVKESNFDCLLTPGLKGKPPLPKKPELVKMDEEIETVRLKSIQFEKNFNLGLKSDEIMSEKEFEDFLDRTTSKIENREIPEINLNREIDEEITSKSEKKTDDYLKSLKLRHDQIDRCITKARKVLDKNKDVPSSKDGKEKTNLSIEINKTKPKFIAKPIPFGNLVKSKNEEAEEEESWMQKNLSPPSYNSTTYLESKVDDWLKNDLGENRSNFVDILERIEDLDQITKTEDKSILRETPERDKDEDVSDSNTYDEIVQILEALEAEDRKSNQKIKSMKEEIANSKIPIIKIIPPNNTRASSATSNSSDQGLGSTASLNSNTSNYNEILLYLDEVDKNSTKSLHTAKEKMQQVTKALEGVINLDTIPKENDLILLSKEELINQIVDLNLRLKDKSSSIKLLQDELSSLREQILTSTKRTEETIKQKLKSQKDDHENTIKRHQKFIDQLIADKKSLNQQCEGLINEMKLLEDRFNSNLKAAEHRHQVEMRKAKEMHLAGEKIRRERWIEGKTQKIKELTVKSIEPELQSMTLRHQQEISDLRSLHKKELEDLELKSARKMQQQLESLREQLNEEREKAVNQERDLMNQRYEKLVESEEKNYQEQRRRLQQEHAKRILQLEEKEVLITAEKDRTIKLIKEEFEEKLQSVVRRHNNEIKSIKESTELDIEAWKNNHRKQQTSILIEKEARMREKFKSERDREIEEVIERLETEANENKQQLEFATENRVKRIREKFENEIKELELSERAAKTKYSETKTKLLEAEDSILNLKALVKQLENRLNSSEEVSNKLSSEKENMKEIVRKEMEEEIGGLKKELEFLKDGKDRELQQVYSRVKIAIAKKDEMLQELSRDYTSLQEKCVYLESMLEQQRKEYLIK